MRGVLVLLMLGLAACGGDQKSESAFRAGATEENGGIPSSGHVFKIKPGANATRDMINAMVSVVPGDVIEFDCGFFDLTTNLQLAHTEAITVRGCGKDKTVLSFRNSNQPNGILAVNVRGLMVRDLTVADTSGNGFELRAVDHGTLLRVRAFWSSAGGRESATPIKAGDDYAKVMDIKCTNPATQDPRAPENIGGDTSSPDYTVSDKAGRYGIYPVGSDNILIDESESIGASDAGIYVGQTNNAIISNSRAAFNVFGFEIENVQGGEYHGNTAECNTGGFLVYDLDGNLRQYGYRTRMYNNIARLNNTYNFTSGGFVGNVPAGSGMITLAYDRLDIFDNTFSDNNTGGIIHASYELFPEGAGRPTEKRIDFYTEGVHIFHNQFSNNGNGLPIPTTNDLQNGAVARLLPALVGAKTQAACLLPQNVATCALAAGLNRGATGFRGAHIVWDGLLDTRNADCAYPTKPDGSPVPEVPTSDEEKPHYGGKPQLTNQDDDHGCHYNKYKFATDPPYARKLPYWFASCIDDDNSYTGDSLKYINFHGTKGLEAVVAAAVKFNPNDPATPDPLLAAIDALPGSDLQNFAASFDMTPHHCTLPRLPPVVIPPFVPSNDTDVAPTQEQIDALCKATMPAGKVNFAAAPVNCPTLDQYNLFANPQDPTSAPNSAHPGGDGDTNTPGVPFVLNTKLFSDYAVKYRVLFMPEGAKAVYRDAASNGDDATLIFPVGTIIAKTFAFANETAGTENVVETRLLIKRVNSTSHTARWDGLAYIWKTVDGRRVAQLSTSGGSASVSWNFHDADSGALLSGSTNYQIPNANQCLSCHSREDMDAGSAPIGPKVRNLNRPYRSESPIVTEQSNHAIKGQNQIAWWCSHGLILGCPSAATMNVNATTQIAAGLERLPVFNKPGDAGFAANTGPDIEARTRAYIEVNCQHCHNVHGFAASTGLYLSASGAVDREHGMCKTPTAVGSSGSGGRRVDIYPTSAQSSIMDFRIDSDNSNPAALMPPLARSVIHVEGRDLIRQWINTVLVKDESKYPNSTACPN